MTSSRPHFAGMTVNERLFVTGLLGEFDTAIDTGDREKAIDVLRRVDLNQSQAAITVDAALAIPEKYGYPRSPE